MRGLGVLALSFLLPVSSVATQPQRDWAREFPLLACRIPHLTERMNHGSRAVRLSIVMSLGSERDSRVLTPFLRAVTNDPDPEIAWRAIGYLYDHGVRNNPTELPARLQVPLSGRVNPRSAVDRERLRERAVKATLSSTETRMLPPSVKVLDDEARRGWALFALALMGDDQVHRIALLLKDSKNEFTRFTAAVALLDTAPPLARGILRDLSRKKVPYYGWRAEEVLARRGDPAARSALIDHLEAAKPDDRFFIAEVLEDLYGFYSTEPSVWRRRVARK